MNAITQEPFQKIRTFYKPKGENGFKIDRNIEMRQVVRFPFFYAEISKKEGISYFDIKLKLKIRQPFLSFLEILPLCPTNVLTNVTRQLRKSRI